jgi:DNA-binding transcriptional regulator LsrR (DeoR family)
MTVRKTRGRPLTRVEIAQRLGISRFKAGRLLDATVEAGLVTITLKRSALIDPEIPDALTGRFGLRQAYAVRVDETPEGPRRHRSTKISEESPPAFSPKRSPRMTFSVSTADEL